MMSLQNPLTFLCHDITPKLFKSKSAQIFLVKARIISTSLEDFNNFHALSVGKVWLEKSEPQL